LSPAEGRKFALTVGTAFLVLAAVAFWRQRVVLWNALALVGALLWVAGLAIPGKLGPLQAAWMAMAHAISRVTMPIFLGIVYFGIITPIGLVMRMIGRNPIRHEPQQGSYWFPRTEHRSDLNRQF
jgi:hypothetical protein